MRQSGTLTEGELLQADAATEIMQSGELVLVRRTDDAGTDAYFPMWVKSQPLTPTFVHDVISEKRNNVNENDQRDFVCVGAILMKDLDELSWQGHQWEVSTTSEMTQNGVTCTTHCLCLKRAKAIF